jgi:GNAT superfamily N-acetyltransferase
MDDTVLMIRENLYDLPIFRVPAPFCIRWYQPGDENAWVALQAPFYKRGAVTLDLFREQFGTDVAALSARQSYLLNEAQEPVGTAAGWTYDGFRGPEYGRVHWVALARDYHGQGLSKPLLGAVCQRLLELGHTKAYLTTSRRRPAAIALYSSFGFIEVAQQPS